jgi:hypothetical protein
VGVQVRQRSLTLAEHAAELNQQPGRWYTSPSAVLAGQRHQMLALNRQRLADSLLPTVDDAHPLHWR